MIEINKRYSTFAPNYYSEPRFARVDCGDGYAFTLTATNPDLLTPATIHLVNKRNRDVLRAAFETPSGEREKDIALQVERKFFEQSNIGDIWTFSKGDKRVYIHEKDKTDATNQDEPTWEVVYSSEKNTDAQFATLAGFLHSPTGKEIQHSPLEPADIALFGTINSNLPGIVAEDWMEKVEGIITRTDPSLKVANPNVKTHVQAVGIDMSQFARESGNLFGAQVIVMNFEPHRGGLGLAELRMAVLASVLTGHKLFVRIEKPHDAHHVERSRAVAIADLEFFQKEFGDKLHMEVFKDTNLISLDELAKKAMLAVQDVKKNPSNGKIHFPLHPELLPHQERIVLSGSSATPTDLAIRMEMKTQLAALGKDIVDTYKTGFSGDVASLTQDERMKTRIQSRKEELETMKTATDHIVYVSGDSLSPFGQFTTALLFAALNGSKLRGMVLNPDTASDIRDTYSTSTYRSHLAKATMNYQLAKILDLLEYFEGVAPEIAKYVPVITDAVGPILDSLTLSEIKNEDRLVPKDFVYDEQEIEKDVVAAVDRVDENGDRFEGYPYQGLKMTDAEYDAWVAAGKPLQTLVGAPDNRPGWFVDHKNRYRDGVLKEGAEDLSNMGESSSDTAPYHPYLKAMLIKSNLGVITGPGYYRRLGPNETADPVVLKVTPEGVIKLLVVEGKDKRGWVLPGGHKEPGEIGLSTAAREAAEETGVQNLLAKPHKEVVRDAVVGDWRATADSWPQTDVTLFFLDEKENVVSPEGHDDAEHASWKVLDIQTLQELNPSHAHLVELALLSLENWRGVTIDKKGFIGRPSS